MNLISSFYRNTINIVSNNIINSPDFNIKINSVFNIVLSNLNYGISEINKFSIINQSLSCCKRIAGKINDFAFSLIYADRNNFSLKLQDSLLNIINMPIEDFGYAVNYAANNGYVDVVQFLLSKGNSLSLIDRNQIAINMASIGNIEILDLILQNGAIEESARNSAILHSSCHNRAQIINMLTDANIIDDQISDDQFSDDDESTEKVQISLEVLKESPEIFLKFVNELEELPQGFRLEEYSLAEDLDGVTKQVISTLFISLQKKFYYKYLSAGKYLINQSEENLSFYKDLAKFLSLVFKSNELRIDKLLIGAFFNKKFFSVLKIYMQDIDQIEKFKQIAAIMKVSENPYYKSLFEYIIESNEANKASLLENALFIEKETKNFSEFLIKEKKILLSL